LWLGSLGAPALGLVMGFSWSCMPLSCKAWAARWELRKPGSLVAPCTISLPENLLWAMMMLPCWSRTVGKSDEEFDPTRRLTVLCS